jgi:WD40 repeat protein
MLVLHVDFTTCFCVLTLCPSERLVSAGDDGLVIVWDYKNGGDRTPRCVKLNGHGGPVFGLAAVGNNRKTLASGSLDKTIRLWQAAKGNDTPTCVRVLTGHTVRSRELRSVPRRSADLLPSQRMLRSRSQVCTTHYGTSLEK